jgi:hypothetical protein
MMLCFKDEEGWDRLPYSVDTSNQSDLLMITRLDSNWLQTSLRGSDYLD